MHKDNRIKSIREAIAIGLVMAFVVFGVSVFLLNEIHRKFGFTGFEGFKAFLTCLLMLEILLVLIEINRMKGLRSLYERHLILTRLERSLISADAVKTMVGCVAVLPKISLDMDAKVITIDLSNVRVRKRIEAVQELLSTALPERYAVRHVFLSSNQNSLLIEFYELTQTQFVFDSPEQYLKEIDHLKQTELLLDKNIKVDLKDYPHILITGATGSGKSYFAMQIAMQGLARNWKVSILDYKQSYHMFKGVCHVAFSIQDIVASLKNSINELHHRQQAMAEVLKVDPNAIAVNHGFPVHLILFEEYLAVVNSGADKKTLAEIEKMLLELVSVGRSLNVNVVMIMQVSSAASLNTSIRSNLPVRLVFGNAPRTILETTFGISDVPAIQTKMPKGAGLIKMELDAVPFHAPELKFPFRMMLELLERKIVIFDTKDADSESEA